MSGSARIPITTFIATLLHTRSAGYCELQGNQVRACFHDRCWGEDAQQCGDFGTTSTVNLWMDVLPFRRAV